MDNTVKPAVAFVGLGAMGAGMAANVLKAGFPVRGYDINPKTAERLNADGGIFCESPADAARGCGVLVVIVMSQPQVDEVLFGANNALDTINEGAVVLGCATTDPAHVADLGKRVEATGRDFVDAPVTGGAHGAEAGTLTALSSGSADAYAKAQDVLAAMCSTIHRFGDRPGAGTTAKMANQLLCGVHLAVAAETVELCRHTGVDTDKLFDVLKDGVAGSAMFTLRAQQLLDREFSIAENAEIFEKDLKAAAKLAREVGLSTPLGDVACDIYTRMRQPH